ncbi:MAG: DUF565 domain-containing protein [Synechococcus lacustris]|nr:DUF565 domain-containing protein [Synechococcus lacustris]MCP9795224.1 DUF565 domain-containing protein [Synechococcus lacustris L1F-Slac]MCP9812560.1 DUF565 domain-containing protein [Synechococcus lacustris Maggiore-St4-Slac]MCP9814877.1 DUF565 domain-containing protein [Synechococcus lacustris L1E-Slac]NBV58401.1 DUF565 domain-containing protein [Synechococcaceae bacterium WB4_2_0811]OON12356.1 MAG: DUF565 domain-containing protein [Synechococcus lacustris str. Tous]HBU27418.1 DUF565 do
MHSPVQNTRLRLYGSQALLQLESWSQNPWRRYSLLLIIFLGGFSTGASIGALAGALSFLDPLAALLCVLVAELAIRVRKPLLRKGGDRLLLGLLDMARMGVIYGLLLEGFKASV